MDEKMVIKGQYAKTAGGRILLLLLSFLAPFILLYFGVVLLGITPFGNHSLAISDGGSYMVGLAGFGSFLRNPSVPLYNFSGLGSNGWVGWAWGSVTLGRLMGLFTTPETAPAMFTWAVLLNLSFSGTAMYLLLLYVRGHRIDNLIFSTSYALIGFNICYCYHLQFFVGVHMLPLMVLGLLKILRGECPLLYIISLGLCIFLNFYFGYMLCAASVFIFIAYLYAERENLSGRYRALIINYAVSSLLAGLLGAAMWLPALRAFSNGGRMDQVSAKVYVSENMPFIQIFSKLFSGANSEAEQVNGLPNIFCGILVVALDVLYFMNPAIPVRRKRAAGTIVGLYLLTFYLPDLTRLMHGGTHTNWFNYRYSFVFSFFLIMLAAEAFEHIEHIELRTLKRCGAMIVISTILVFSVKYEYVTGAEVLFDLALMFIMGFFLWLRNTKPEKLRWRFFAVLELMIVSVNLLGNFLNSTYKVFGMDMDLNAYRNGLIISGGSIDAIKKYDDSLYRMEKDFSESGTSGFDATTYGYLGVGGSGPTVKQFIHTEANKIGLNWLDMRHYYSDGIPAATDALLGIKYILATRDLETEKGYTVMVRTDTYTTCLNPYALPFAILSNPGIEQLELGNNLFTNMNEIWKAMTGGNKDVFIMEEDLSYHLHNTPETLTLNSDAFKEAAAGIHSGDNQNPNNSAYIVTEFTAKRDGTVYRFDTSVPGSSYGSLDPSIKCLGYHKAGETVRDVNFTNATSITQEKMVSLCQSFVYAYEDHEVLGQYAQQLQGRNVTFNRNRNEDLTGTYETAEDRRLLFTLAWDEGWTCYIDGKEVPVDKTLNLFMSVNAPKGSHTYEMKFFPMWMNYGLMISGAAGLGLLIYMLIWGWLKARRAKLKAVGTN